MKDINSMSFTELYREYKLILNLKYLDCIVKDEDALNEFYSNFFNVAKEDFGGEEYTTRFLLEHSDCIDKEAYVFYTLKTINEYYEAAKFPEVADKCKKALANSNYVHYEIDKNSKGDEIEIKRVTAQELLTGKKSKEDVKDRERIELLEQDIPLEELFSNGSIGQMDDYFGKNFILNRYISGLGLVDSLSLVEPLSKKQKIKLLENGKKLREKINANMDELKEKGSVEILYKYLPVYIRKYPSEFDLDSVLLLAAYKATVDLEYEELTEEQKFKCAKLLQVAEKHVKSSSALVKLVDMENNAEVRYSYKNLQEACKRITKDGEYFPVMKENELREKMSSDANVIRDVGIDYVKIMKFSLEEYKELVENNDGILGYLVQNDLISANNYKVILNLANIRLNDFMNLVDTGKVDENQVRKYLSKQECIDAKLFGAVSEKGLVSDQEVLDYYLNGRIDIKDVIQVSDESKSGIADLLSIDKLVDLYKDEERKDEYIKYANIFRTVVLSDKSSLEKDEISDSIVEELGLEFENEDLVRLYQEHLISLKTVEGWGGSALITEMMRSAMLKPSDVKDICRDGNYDSIFEIMKDAWIPRQNKLAIFYTTFADEDDTLTPEQQELRELAKDECIKYMNFVDKNIKGLSRNVRVEKNRKDDKEVKEKRKEYVSDPLNRWTLVKLLDEDYSYEMLAQGMMIFKLPNLNGGTVILEKMFRKEVPEYGRATKILHMSIEEFEQIKKDLVIDGDIPVGAVNRHLSLKDRVDSLQHSASWGQKLADLFDYQLDSNRSKENVERIDKEISRIKSSRKLR